VKARTWKRRGRPEADAVSVPANGYPVRGHVIFGGRRFPVTAVRLAGGAVRITWEVDGPYEGGTSPVTVFGEDGRGIAQVGEARVPGVPGSETMALTHIWTIMDVTDL
jgi:hypothetical protein